MPIVLFDKDYWTRLVNFDALVEDGMINAEDLDLFRFADTAEATWEELLGMGLKTP